MTTTSKDCLVILAGAYHRILQDRLFPQVLFATEHEMVRIKNHSQILMPTRTFLQLEDRMEEGYVALDSCIRKHKVVSVIYHSETLDSQKRIYDLPSIGLGTVILYMPDLTLKKLRRLEEEAYARKLPVTIDCVATHSSRPRKVLIIHDEEPRTTRDSLLFFSLKGRKYPKALIDRKVFGEYRVLEKECFFTLPVFYERKTDGAMARQQFEAEIKNLQKLYKPING
jgi:hypothetical protein